MTTIGSLLVLIAASFLYVQNIMKYFSEGETSFMKVLRFMGFFFAPLGVFLGIF